MTVLEVKKLISECQNIPTEQQRLIFVGKILKDEETLAQMKEGTTIHLGKPKTEAAPTQATTAPNTARTPAVANPSMFPTIPSMFPTQPNPGAAAGYDPMQIASNPQMMRLALEMMRNNPGMVQSMMQNNPQMQAMSPEMRSMMSNPQFIESMLQPGVLDTLSSMQGNMGSMGDMGNMGMGGMPGFQMPPV